MNGLARVLMSLALGAAAILGFFFLTTVGVMAAVATGILLVLGSLSVRWGGGHGARGGRSRVILFRRINGRTVITRHDRPADPTATEDPLRPMKTGEVHHGPCVELSPDDYRKLDKPDGDGKGTDA